MFDNIASAFKTTMAIINPIPIATFLNKTYTANFDHFLVVGSLKGGLFSLISTYFGTVETNRRGMLYLHCLVRLKDIINLSNF